MALVAGANYKALSDDELRSHIEKLNLDPVGPRSTLLDRIARHLASQSNGITATGAQVNGKASNGSNKGGENKKQRRKKKKNAGPVANGEATPSESGTDAKPDEVVPNVEIEYVAAPLPQTEDPAYEEYTRVFEKFVAPVVQEGEEKKPEAETEDNEEEDESNAKDGNASDSSDDDEDGKGGDKLSRKKMRKLNRLTVAELKQLVRKPEVVDWVDVSAADPKLLVHLKSYRNSVPVPVHWQQKRKYLQGKRGIEKAPFELPDFIKATGIMEMRSAVKDKEDASKLKSKTRERHQPKMGKLDIDYQKLHDAFFRWQTKPKFTIHGDVYYEGKEFETKLKAKKPGQLSEELKAALNMPPLAPPPWLINMQRYGPPPSYPQLKVAGLNAPIPEGAQWGYHPGGWGKPPVDEYGRPLYGDVFGTMAQEVPTEHVAPIERSRWGELEEEEEEEYAEETDEGEQEDEEEEDDTATESGLVTPSGISSVPSGLETPDYIELRKDGRSNEPKQLYTVVPERQTAIKGFMGSQHGYDLSAAGPSNSPPPPPPTEGRGQKRKAGPGAAGIDLALNPEDLESGLDESTLRKKYEQQLDVSKANQEDFSDMVADHASRQAKRAKKDDKAKGKDKSKNFKF
ncbi:uncharacterized protein EV422DRAFT_34683 [Fimicolochytrium jonesii]|uniref:uncharacterized protein n=1 Tax=Fimicolochytrium jonesii TaxID=1396493 RepID=UPI0022FE6B7F|nr:uncharacterized protein EV422DRAFT_34683 [Fimicolochytrium jonesii]KAI8827283.1 hypothetical protein EV422DRAFT_34683 [Fimicolochytrium jonesii]